MYKILKKIYQYINISAVTGTSNKCMPLEKQKEYLESFDEPQDDYQRSYYKFKCFCEYCYYQKKWILFIYNIGALVLYPFLYRKLCKKGELTKRSETTVDALVENVVRLPNKDILPEEIKKKYTNVIEIRDVNYKGVFLNTNAKKICKELRKRYFWKFYFRIVIMMKLAQFSKYIEEYNPKAIIFYSCEREFSGPLQTYFCELDGISYEAFMHGDYLYQLCFAFQRYTRYYTWDKTYNAMFNNLRCNFPMTIYKPDKLKGIAEKIDDHECKYFATYYFSDETREGAEKIYEIFKAFSNIGLRCKIRPHPRFSDTSMLLKVFSDIEIEDFRTYSLENSIKDSMYIIGLNTTVLSEGYFSGKNIVIDNISMLVRYLDLKDKGYIMMNRPHLLLTELIDSVKSKQCYDENYKFRMN